MNKPTQVDIINLSEFIIAYHQLNGVQITQLKLQKILYYTQAWHLVHFEKNLIFQDVPEAWVNGPVYERVYRKYVASIDQPLKVPGFVDTNFYELFANLKLNVNQQEFIYAIFRKYGSMSDEKLVYLTHNEAPWLEARGECLPFERSTNKISFDTMYDFYSRQIRKTDI